MNANPKGYLLNKVKEHFNAKEKVEKTQHLGQLILFSNFIYL